MNDFLLTREVAELLRTPESTVRYWRHVRTGPPSIKVGRRVLYSRDAVLAWLQERETTSESINIAPPSRSDQGTATMSSWLPRQRGPR
ncbi:helix-turn-helix domain-containing protein [Quadrisphaera sp. INWT6]|uniref:helix-turn-helix domain-containing protein n=1 Tax=Quadrisphaera sp. INWT6 TaxID=2596917 RepID=UPI0018928867|nr:helix-turn-helix domain-containing protein [Quadrisphaera sp. INWT6]